MKNYENLAAILILGVVAAMAVFFKVLDGTAKDVVLTVVSGLIGFIGRGAYQPDTTK